MSAFAVYLDLDGVLADYEEGIKRLGFVTNRALARELNRSGTDNPVKRAMYDAIRGTNFYRTLPLTRDAVSIYRAASAIDRFPAILTAAPKFGATEDDFFHNPYWQGAALHKRCWVEFTLLPAVQPEKREHRWGLSVLAERSSYVPISDEHFICTTSARKHRYLNHKHGIHQVLVDDREKNVSDWIKAGGIGILHDPVDPEATLIQLEALRSLAA